MSEQERVASPNVIWVIADQWRAQAVGYAGDPDVATPNIDRLAAEGAVFTRALAGAPLCCPARGSMVTGRYPLLSGVAGHQEPLPSSSRTVATELRDAGYRTCYVGKWHLDGNRPELGAHTFSDTNARVRMIPPERRAGFQDWWAYENNNQPFDCLVHTDAGQVPDGATVVAEDDGMELFRLPGYETDASTDLMLEWLRGHARDRSAQPFFSVLSVQPPHNPYVAPEGDMFRHTPGGVQLRENVPDVAPVRERARRDLAGYYAAIERFDHNLGRLRAELDELGLAQDTYIVVTSDHGDMHGSHGQWRKTAPWEESIRIPFVVGGPSRDHQERRDIDAPVSHVDLPATTLGLCGLPVPEFMQGTDVSPAIRSGRRAGDDRLPDSAYIGIPVPTGHPDSVDRAWHGVVTRDNWKYVTLDGQPWLLFDHNADPLEMANLAHNSRYAARRAELDELLHEWLPRVGATSEALAR